MDLPNNKTFCVAPWFQIRNENDGSKRVCCAIKSKKVQSTNEEPLEFLNSSDNLVLKRNLHQGVKDDACMECWRNEDNGRISLRQKLNGVLTNNASSINKTWIESYFKRKNDFLSEDVFMADIKIGNTCNYACVMCIPEDSSLIYNEWKKRPDVFFIEDKLQDDPGYLYRIKNTGYANKNYKQYVKKVLSNKRLKYLKLLGGEPLLDNKLLTELSSLPEEQKRNLSLYIVTNGSQDLMAVKQYLGNFKSIMFTISLEGTSQVQDYARYGSDWNKVSKNILSLKESSPRDVMIHTTLQTTTILGFKDLAEWTNKNNLALSLGVCQQPNYLSFSSLPNAVRSQVKSSLTGANIKINQNTVGDEVAWPVEKIIDIIDRTEFDYDSYDKFMKYIKWYEHGKKITPLKEIFPSLFIDKNQNLI
jgi:wyosine [tRNA(Phe)-imidazoG37] synthetase (radical SAM superfamily)